MHVYILYIYLVWWEEALVGNASQVACGVSYTCLLLYVPVHVFHQRCVHMHKVLRPVPKAFVTGIAHLRPGLWFRLKKPFIYVRRHMCLYCVCVRWNDVHNKFLTL